MNKEEFINEIKKLGINLTDKMLSQLDKYYKMLIEYNKNINLTRITKEEDVYLKHFYDSLTIAKEIDLNNNYKLCDVGSGAGLPGIVLKIVYPTLNITLVDALDKRIKFLDDVIKKLDLKDINAVHQRIEDIKEEEIYDIIVSRAVARTSIILELAIKTLKKGGLFILYKGDLTDELNNIEKIEQELGLKLISKNAFLLPVENSTRTLLVFKKIAKTSNKYPRLFAKIKSNPL